jgi:hypothetical protein
MKNIYSFPAKKVKSLLLSIVCFITALTVFMSDGFAQTNPTAQNLTYSQNFGTSTFTVMPTGTSAWTVSGSPKGTQSSAESSTANGNATITAATTAQSTGGCYGYSTSSNGRLYIQTSSNTTNGTNQIATAIVTTNLQNIKVSYNIEMISVTARTVGVVLQYRVGTSGSWTTVSGSTYSHNNSDRSAGQVDNFTNLSLPAAVENNAVVQLRWAIWRGSESGNSSGIAIDNISITGSAIPTAYYFRSKQTGNWNSTSSWEMSTDNSNWVNATFTPNYNCKTITIQSGHQITLTASDTVDQVIVNGTLTYGDYTGNVLSIHNETGVDLTINGTFEDFGPSSIAWLSSTTWEMGSSGTLIKTRSTSSNYWRDHYNSGISNIPSTANWIVRKTSGDSPSISSTGGMYYPNLTIENNTGSTWTTGSSSSFTGSSDYPRVKGNLDIGGSGTGNVSFMSENTNSNSVLVAGNLNVKSGSTLRNYGTGFEVQGNLSVNGTITYDSDDARKILISGGSSQNISGSGTINVYDLIINKTANNISLSKTITVDHQLTLTSGNIVLGTNNLILGTTATISGGSASSYVTTNSTGRISKKYASTGSTFTFPTGDGTYYTPYILILNSATLGSDPYISVRVINTAEPHITSYSDYAARYWDVSTNDITNINADVSYSYADNDITGTESNFLTVRWNATSNLKKIGTVNAATNTTSAAGITEMGNFTAAGICNDLVAEAGNDTTIVEGDSIQIGVSPVSSYTYSWKPVIDISDPDIANPIVYPSDTIAYYVNVTDVHGCSSNDSVYIFVNRPLLVNAGNDTTIDFGDKVTIGGTPTASGGIPPYTYIWSPPQGITVTCRNANPIAQPIDTVSYSVTVTDVVGNSASDGITINVILPEAVTQLQNTFSLTYTDTLTGKDSIQPMYVYDRFGTKILMNDIRIQNYSEIAGMFILHFWDDDHDSQLGFDHDPVNNPDGDQRRAVVIQVFRDISELLGGNLPNNPYTGTPQFVQVNIKQSLNSSGNAVLGQGGQFFQEPGNLGIVYGNVWGFINSEVDPYWNLNDPAFVSVPVPPMYGAGYYHGELLVNFGHPFYLGTNDVNVPAGDFDLYTVVLHEVMHMLGIGSRITENSGTISNLAPGYSIWDDFLYVGGATQKLLDYDIDDLNDCTPATIDGGITLNDLCGSCTAVDPHFIAPNGPNSELWIGTCPHNINYFSHFHCTHSATNVMNPGLSDMEYHRFPAEEEAQSLCAIGYSVLGSYGDGGAVLDNLGGTIHNYASACPSPREIAGANDFFENGTNGGTAFSVLVGQTIDFFTAGITNNIIANDNNALTFSCPRIIIGDGTIANIAGGFSYQPGTVSATSGSAVVAYNPVNALGQRGNTTYIFIRILPLPIPPCPPQACDLVCHGDFEVFTDNNALRTNLSDFFINLMNIPENSPDLRIDITNNNNHYVLISAYDMGFWANTPFEGITFELNRPIDDGCTANISFRASSLYNSGNNQIQFRMLGSTSAPCTAAADINSVVCNTPSLQCPAFTPFCMVQQPILNICPLPYNGTTNTPDPLLQQYNAVWVNNTGVPINNITIVANAANSGFLVVDDIQIQTDCETQLAITAVPTDDTPCINSTVSINYQVCLTGNSVTNATAITLLANLLQAGMTYGAGGDFVNGEAIIPANTLNPGNNCINLVLNIDINNTAIGGVPLNIELVSTSQGVCFGSNILNNLTTLTPGWDNILTINKTVSGPSTYVLNDIATYTIEICNTSSSVPINGIVVEDILPAELNFLTALTPNFNVVGQTITSNSIDLSINDCAIISYTAQVVANTTCGTIENCASVIDAPIVCDLPIESCVSIHMAGTYLSVNAGTDVSMCAGSNTTLNAVGSNGTAPYTYSWAPATGLSSTTISNPVANPTVTTTYTITVTDANGCAASDDVLVTVNDLPSVYAGADLTICQGGSGLIGPMGHYLPTVTFSWSPATGLNNPNTQQPTASPTATTIYTVTLTDMNGCTGTDDVTVSIDPNCICNGLSISTTWITGFSPSANTLFSLQSDATVPAGNTVTLTDVNIVMAPNVKIIIDPTASLTLSHCYLYSCTDMWEGIVANGTLNIINGTLIEDAITAVDLSNVAAPFLTIGGSVFNKNRTGVNIDNYQATGTYPFTIENTVFTCRDFNLTPPYTYLNTWPEPSSLNNLANTGTLNEHYDIGGYSSTNLNIPYSTELSYSGIAFNDVGTISGGIYYEALIDGDDGNSTINIFDNMRFGISATNSDFTCQNNVFQNIIAQSTTSNDGYGIISENTAIGTSFFRLQALDFNNFYDCTRGIDVNGYDEVSIENTNMRSTQQAVSGNPLSLAGDLGIYIKTPYCTAIHVLENTITNVRNGIVFIGDEDAINSTQRIGPVTINNNTVQATLDGISGTPVNEYVLNGIIADNIITYWPGPTYSQTGAIVVSNNHLYQVHNGIHMQGWVYFLYNPYVGYFNRAYTISNYVSMRKVQYPNTSNQAQYGIMHELNWNANITNNNVQGFDNAYTDWYGIYSHFNINYAGVSTLNCNNTTNTGTGIKFDGDQYHTAFRNNTMDNNNRGYVIDNARIGTQGYDNEACGNKWINYTVGNFKTYTMNVVTGNTDEVNSKLYIDTSDPDQFPQGAYNSGVISSYFIGNGLEPVTTNTNVPNCNIPSSKLINSEDEEDSEIMFPSQLSWLELIAIDSINYAIFEAEQRINAKHNLYRLLQIETALLDSSLILHDFYINAQNGNIGTLANAENALAEGLLSDASDYINSVTPANAIETNYKNFYNIYLHWKQNTYSAEDYVNLKALINGCITRDGVPVQQARALYRLIYSDFITRFDNCTDSVSKITTDIKTSISNLTDMSFKLYPNPNNGSMILDYSIGKNENAKMIIYDISGKKLATYTLNAEQTTLSINEPILCNGIYYCTIMINDDIVETKKIVILK